MGGGRGAFFRSLLQQQRQRRRRRRRRVLSPPTQLPCILLLLLFHRHRPSTFGLSQDHGWRRRRRLRGTRKGALPEQTGRGAGNTEEKTRGRCLLFASHSPFRHLRAEYPSLPPPSSAVPSLILLVRNFPPRAFLALFPGKSRGKKVVLAVGTTLRKEGKCLPQFPFSSLFRVGTEDGFFELRSVGRTPSPTLILPFFRPPLSGGARALEGGSFPPPPPKGGREVPQPVT